MSIPFWGNRVVAEPSANDATPNTTIDAITEDSGGSAGFDSYAVPQFVRSDKIQQTTAYVFTVKVPTITVPHDAGIPHPVQQIQVDFPQQPEWYVIDVTYVTSSGNPNFCYMSIGQNASSYPSGDAAFTVIGARGANGDNKDRVKIIVKGEAQHVFLSVQECPDGISSNTGFLDVVVFAVSGIDPRILGVQ